MRLIAIWMMLLISGKLFSQNESEKQNPLILIDTLITYNESMILHPSKFISISTLNAQKATEIYGVNGRFGLIKIHTMPDIEFVRLTAILDRFKVEEKYRGFRVCINRKPVSEPAKLLADMKEIKNVEIIQEKAVSSDAGDQYYINIITQPGS